MTQQHVYVTTARWQTLYLWDSSISVLPALFGYIILLCYNIILYWKSWFQGNSRLWVLRTLKCTLQSQAPNELVADVSSDVHGKYVTKPFFATPSTLFEPVTLWLLLWSSLSNSISYLTIPGNGLHDSGHDNAWECYIMCRNSVIYQSRCDRLSSVILKLQMLTIIVPPFWVSVNVDATLLQWSVNWTVSTHACTHTHICITFLISARKCQNDFVCIYFICMMRVFHT